MKQQSEDPPDTPPIRVLCFGMSTILTEYFKRLILQQPDMLFVGTVQEYGEVLFSLRRRIDVLVMSAVQAAPMPGICTLLFAAYPSLRVIVIGLENEEAYAYTQSRPARKLPTLDGDVLIAQIRDLHYEGRCCED